MIRKGIKHVAVVTFGTIAVGLFVFGTDVFSYVSTSARSVKTAVKDNVPIEFELQRARDMIEQILPELQANIRLIAQEEVEIATLEKEITRSDEDLTKQQRGIAKLRGRLDTQQVSFNVSNANYSREQLTERLAHRFERYKESKTTMVGRERLLEARRRSLAAAEQMLEKITGTAFWKGARKLARRTANGEDGWGSCPAPGATASWWRTSARAWGCPFPSSGPRPVRSWRGVFRNSVRGGIRSTSPPRRPATPAPTENRIRLSRTPWWVSSIS